MKIEGHMTLVHRAWGRLEDAELLGAFTYQMHAEKVARAIIEAEGPQIALILTDLTSGKMTIIHKPAEAAHAG